MVFAVLRIASCRRIACGCRVLIHVTKRRLTPDIGAGFHSGLFRRRKLRFAPEPQDSIHNNVVNDLHRLDRAQGMCHGELGDLTAL
jgi:hypothetical protein